MKRRTHWIGFAVSVLFFFIAALVPAIRRPAIRRPAIRLEAYRITGSAQGTSYAVTYYARRETVTKIQTDSIFKSLDASLSIYQPGSLINTFNAAPDGVEMDNHLRRVVEKSLEIFRETGGLFDITVYPLVRAWGFGTKATDAMPDSNAIREILPCVGSRKLQISGRRLSKANPCVQIDVNGIAQGYSVDVVAGFLELRGIANYIVEVGGEIRVKGRKYPGKELMKIGIETPALTEFDAPVIREVIRIGEGAVTTSGSYRKYRESGGLRLSHIIDPATGFPVQREIVSATVVAPDAMTADGFDNDCSPPEFPVPSNSSARTRAWKLILSTNAPTAPWPTPLPPDL
jgi:FAD:protein FMN transferase